MTNSYCWITIVTVQKYGGIRKSTMGNHIYGVTWAISVETP